MWMNVDMVQIMKAFMSSQMRTREGGIMTLLHGKRAHYRSQERLNKKRYLKISS